MRKFLLLLTIVCSVSIYAPPIWAQSQSIFSEEMGSEPFLRADKEYHFYTFYKDNPNKSDWSFFILLNEEKIYELYGEKNTSIFRVIVPATPYHISWKQCKRFYSPNQDTCFFQGYIVNHTYRDTLAVKLFLLPTKPIIKEVSLGYDYYDYEYHLLEEARLAVTLQSSNAKSIDIDLSRYQHTKIDPKEKALFELTFYSLEATKTDSLFYCKDIICSENQWFRFFARNPFGFSTYSDTLLVNDFIQDRAVLEDLNLFTGITPLSSPVEVYTTNDNVLEIVSDQLSELFVYTLSGKMVLYLHRPTKGTKRRLPKGIYLLHYTLHNKKYTQKIRL